MSFTNLLRHASYNDYFVSHDTLLPTCYSHPEDILFFHNFQSLYQSPTNCAEQLSLSKEYLIFFWHKISNFQFYDSSYLYIDNIDNR